MSVRERTSIELPRALSGSNELMACPDVASTRTVPGWIAALAALICADAIPLWATRQKLEMVMTAPASPPRRKRWVTTFIFIRLDAHAIVPPFALACSSAENDRLRKELFHCVKELNALPHFLADANHSIWFEI